MYARKAGNQKPSTIVLLLAALLFFSIMWGCTTTSVDPQLVAKFKPPVTPTDQETAVYIVRINRFAGSALSAWVSCNESYVSELSSGSYCYFKTRSGLNTITIETSGTPVAWRRIDDLPGESIFLKLDYASGTLERVSRDQGITLIMLCEQAIKYKDNAKSDRYETVLMNPGLVGLHLMKPSGNDGALNFKDHATITFIRNSSVVKEMSTGLWGGMGWGGNSNKQADPDIEIPSGKQGIPIGIWSKDGWIGNLMEETYLQVQIPPGDHLFFCKGESWSVLQANVEAGKQYAILVETSRGFQHTGIQFAPIEADAVQKGDVNKWLNTYTHLTKDNDAIEASIQSRLQAALPLIQRAAKMVADGELTPVLVAALVGR